MEKATGAQERHVFQRMGTAHPSKCTVSPWARPQARDHPRPLAGRQSTLPAHGPRSSATAQGSCAQAAARSLPYPQRDHRPRPLRGNRNPAIARGSERRPRRDAQRWGRTPTQQRRPGSSPTRTVVALQDPSALLTTGSLPQGPWDPTEPGLAATPSGKQSSSPSPEDDPGPSSPLAAPLPGVPSGAARAAVSAHLQAGRPRPRTRPAAHKAAQAGPAGRRGPAPGPRPPAAPRPQSPAPAPRQRASHASPLICISQTLICISQALICMARSPRPRPGPGPGRP